MTGRIASKARKLLLVWCAATAGALAVAQQRPIAGRVVDARDAPVAGASVEVRWLPHAELPAGVGWTLRDAPTDARLSTGADGVFRFEPPGGAAFLARAEHGGHASAQAFPLTPGDFVQLQLEPPISVRGTVRDDGAPVAGADVRLVDADSLAWWRRSAYRFPDGVAATRSDADGRFELPLERGYLTHAIWYPLRGVEALGSDGRTTGPLPAVRAHPGHGELALALTAPPVTVRVRDTRGAPVVGARLMATRRAHAVARTDADGIARVPACGTTVWVAADGYELVEAALDPRRLPAAEVHLRPAGRVMVGAVRVDGAPLPDARVLVSTPSFSGPPFEIHARTGPGGQLDVRGLPDGAEAHLFVEVDRAFRPLLRATGPSMAIAAVDVGPVRHVAGQVLDGSGVPAAHVRVGLRAEGWPSWVTWADRAGRFWFDLAVPGDRPVVLAAEVDGHGVARLEVDPAAVGDAPVVLRAVPGGAVVGTVVDERGEPVAGAWVSMLDSAAGPLPLPGPAERFSAQVVFADDRGRFRFDGVAEDREPSVIAVAMRGGQRLQGSAAPVVTRRDGDVVEFRVTLAPIAR